MFIYWGLGKCLVNDYDVRLFFGSFIDVRKKQYKAELIFSSDTSVQFSKKEYKLLTLETVNLLLYVIENIWVNHSF